MRRPGIRVGACVDEAVKTAGRFIETLLTLSTKKTISVRIAICLLIFLLSSLTSTQAQTQQVMVTFSRGANGDAFKTPKYVVFDKNGNLFVSDSGNHRVKRIDKLTGAVATVAGSGVAGGTDANGDLYVSDSCQHLVWKVTPGSDGIITGASDELISNFAGNRNVADCNSDHSGVLAAQAAIDGPASR